MKRLIAGATVIACMLMGSAAFAKDHGRDGKWEGRDRRERVEAREHRDYERREAFRRARWDRDHDRDHRPAGWDKGKKRGWGDCDMPPGQAKKHGCYDHDRRYHHTRRIVRRSPNTGIWHRPGQTTNTTTTTTRSANVGTWRRPTVTQQTTTTTSSVPAQPSQPTGTWHRQ